ncbi:MAG: ABC transporter permease [Verrucomicrobia bacterium]|nr:ABC transporter permease [Verrucomicrobiota bacterium]MBV9643007.1 ABC transporter permease [Verrucomicrobiota bacterium]
MLGGLIAVAVLVFSTLTPNRFLSADTLRAIAFQMPELGILSLAMMVPLMSGGLNLAIIATANCSALVMAAILTRLIQPSMPSPGVAAIIALALLAGMLTSLGIGFLTGVIVAFLGVHPILVTLGTMTLVKGAAVLATSGTVIAGFPPAVLFLGNGTLIGFPVSLILFLLCATIVAVILTHAPFGVSVRMIGSNERATRYSGVPTEWVLVGVYVVSSLLCWVAALLMMARFNSASAGYAESYLLITILAAVLGGVDPFGGFGRVLGLCLSLVLLQVISTGFNLLGFSPYLTAAIWGATMILAIVIAMVRDRWISRSTR